MYFLVNHHRWLSLDRKSQCESAVNIHCVSKNVPPLTCYNLYIHGSIATIFGTDVAEKVRNQNILYFPTSPNISIHCSCYKFVDDNLGKGISSAMKKKLKN